MMNRNIDKIVNHLDRVKPNKNGYTACCPAHDDKTPSLSFWEDGDDVRFKCFAGCDENDIKAALIKAGVYTPPDPHADSKTYSPCFEKDMKPLALRNPTADVRLHVYRDAQGKVLGTVVRDKNPDGTKSITVYTPHNVNGDIMPLPKGFPEPRPLYHLDKLTADPQKMVLVVEGEKAAEAAQMHPDLANFVVTTWQGGVVAVNKADWSPLRGRRVLIWPDNDDPGRKAAASIASILNRSGSAYVAIVELPRNLPEKFDLGDPIPDGFSVQAVIEEASRRVQPLSSMVINANDLLDLSVTERENIIVPFFKENSLNMLYAARGVGKTWIALLLAQSISTGQNFLCYPVPKSKRVLLVDGEMPLADLKSRLELIGHDKTNQNLFLLCSEILYQNDQPLNIHSPVDQAKILRTLDELREKGRGVDVIIFDNLSSLSIGVDENDNTDLDGFLRWLLKLRHSNYAVLLVHHAGKNGDQRGASRREDLLDTVIQLKKPLDPTGNPPGANFILTFTKTRGLEPNPLELNINLRENEHGKLVPTFNQHIRATAAMKTLAFIDTHKPKSQKEISLGLEIDKSTVSLHVASLKGQGYLRSNLEITQAGLDALKSVAIPQTPEEKTDAY